MLPLEQLPKIYHYTMNRLTVAKDIREARTFGREDMRMKLDQIPGCHESNYDQMMYQGVTVKGMVQTARRATADYFEHADQIAAKSGVDVEVVGAYFQGQWDMIGY
jgi:hypothetical protein